MGDSGNDTIIGGPGNDELAGRGGNDSVLDAAYPITSGGSDPAGGSNFLSGGPGADTIGGGIGLDTANYGDPKNPPVGGVVFYAATPIR